MNEAFSNTLSRTRVYKPLPVSFYIRLVCDGTFEVKHSLVSTDCDLQLELARS